MNKPSMAYIYECPIFLPAIQRIIKRRTFIHRRVRVWKEGEMYGRKVEGRGGMAWRNDGGYPLRYSFGDMPTCSRKNFPSDDWLLKCRSLAISFMVFVVLRSRRRISSDV